MFDLPDRSPMDIDEPKEYIDDSATELLIRAAFLKFLNSFMYIYPVLAHVCK